MLHLQPVRKQKAKVYHYHCSVTSFLYQHNFHTFSQLAWEKFSMMVMWLQKRYVQKSMKVTVTFFHTQSSLHFFNEKFSMLQRFHLLSLAGKQLRWEAIFKCPKQLNKCKGWVPLNRGCMSYTHKVLPVCCVWELLWWWERPLGQFHAAKSYKSCEDELQADRKHHYRLNSTATTLISHKRQY